MDIESAAGIFMKVAQDEKTVEAVESAVKGIPPEQMRELKNRAILIADKSQNLYRHVSNLLIPVSPDRVRAGYPDWRAWLMNRPGSASITTNISNLLNTSKNLVNVVMAEDAEGLRAATQRYRQAYDDLYRSGVFPLSWWQRGTATPYPALYVIGESLIAIERFIAVYAQKMAS